MAGLYLILYSNEHNFQHLMVYPISLGSTKLINIVAICSWPEKENTTSTEDMVVRPCDKTEIQDLYNEWEPEVQQLLEACIPLRKYVLYGALTDSACSV